MRTETQISVRMMVVVSFLFGVIVSGSAQKFFTKGFTHDILSMPSYQKIADKNKEATKNLKWNTIASKGYERIVTRENNELGEIHPILRAKQGYLERFVLRDSQKYIKNKYRKLTPRQLLLPSVKTEFLKNTNIQLRLNRKLVVERKNIANYLHPENYMTEGDRIYLLLNALEKVIQITLENEEF